MTVQRPLALPDEPIRLSPNLERYRADPTAWLAQYAERQRRDQEHRERWQPIWDAERRALETCPLKGPHAGEPGRCGLCGGELPRTSTGRIHPNRRWCSTACSDGYWQNHGWRFAATAALRRDGWRCTRCRHAGYGTTAAPPGTFTDEERQDLRALEVNHRIPRNGRGYYESCAHHLEGLETLCRPCHAQETSKQIRARRLARGLRILIGIRTGELTVQYHARRVARSAEAVPEPIWADL